MSPSVEPTSSETDVCVQETLSLIFWILQCLGLIALSQALLIPTQSPVAAQWIMSMTLD